MLGWGGEIQDLVLGGAAVPLGAGLVSSFNHYFVNLADTLGVAQFRDIALLFLEDGQAANFFGVGDGVLHGEGRGVGAGGIFEAEDGVVADGFEQRKRVFEVSFGFAGEADDDVGGNAD